MNRSLYRSALLMLTALLFSSSLHAAMSEADEPASIWGLGLAVGIGERSNPLYGGSDIPLVVLPEVYYYGERVFFDNGRLGLHFYEEEDREWSFAVRLNPERAYFSRRYLGNWLSDPFAPRSQQGNVIDVPLGTDTVTGSGGSQVTVETVQGRDWSIDGGIQLDWEPHRRWLVRANVWTDISNQHGGYTAQFQLARLFDTGLGQFTIRTELEWKSADLIDYYYGVSAADSNYTYRGKSVYQPALGIYWNYALNPRWRLLGFARQQWLGSGMTDSPLVRDNSVHSVFLGVGYRF